MINPFEKALIEIIRSDWEGIDKPSMEECQEFVASRIEELKGLPSFLSSMPFDACDGSLLNAAIEQATKSVNWGFVYDAVYFEDPIVSVVAK